MAADYSALKLEIADFYERNDLGSVVDTFIDLCEAEMQRELKLLSFEVDGTITVTDGTGALPTGFNAFRRVTWDSELGRPLTYITPQYLDRLQAGSPSYANNFTIVGGNIKVSAALSGTLNVTYKASFSPLSGSNTTNAILTSHPAAYLYGSLVHAAVYCKDPDGASGYRTLFNNELDQIKKDNNERRFTGQMVVRLA
jgi:hypothetical protein